VLVIDENQNVATSSKTDATATEPTGVTPSATESAVPSSTTTGAGTGAAKTTEPEVGKTESASGPAATTDSSVTAGDSSKAQNDVRDPSAPETHPDKAAARENVDDSQGVDTDDNPVKVDGPGPRPVNELAKERGGDAGNVGADSGASGADAAAAGAGDEDEDGPQSKSKGEGTGEQYVKSSGLQADGGDFDATKPGAGREADRRLYPTEYH
jgi:hypothetical protein